MNILLLDLGREMRGGQRQVLHLTRRLAASDDFDVDLVAPAGSPLLSAARAEALPATALPSGRYWDPRCLVRLLSAVRRKDVRLIHTNCAKSAALGAMAKKLRPSVKLVHSRRVSYPLGAGSRLHKYAAGDMVIAVSKEIEGVVVASGIDPDKATTIHSGIDPTEYPQADGARRDAPVIGFVGALTEQKGAEVLLRALALLQETAWQAVLVGDGPLRGGLERMAAEFGLAERVEWTGWKDSREVLPGVDILVVPSVDGEGSNAVIKEGWAVGVAVIASDLPSNAELVENGLSGLLFRSQEAEAAAQALLQLLRNAQERSRLAEGGRSRLAEFTVDKTAELTMAVYRRLLTA